jgi:glycosyltransferase involved in cell wall biosynthesis
VLTPDAALAVAPNDPGALADAVCDLVGDDARRERMGVAARALAIENYSWPTIARRLEEVYTSVTGIGRDEARAA